MEVIKLEIAEISQEDFDSYVRPATGRGKYQNAIQAVKATGTPVKVSGLKRGQVSALVRAVKDAELLQKAHYPTKDEATDAGFVLISK